MTKRKPEKSQSESAKPARATSARKPGEARTIHDRMAALDAMAKQGKGGSSAPALPHAKFDAKGVAKALNLRGVTCPINFVKTKIQLEMMVSGQLLQVTIDPGEPMKNVPRSVQEDGHTILDDTGNPDGTHTLTIRKK